MQEVEGGVREEVEGMTGKAGEGHGLEMRLEPLKVFIFC